MEFLAAAVEGEPYRGQIRRGRIRQADRQKGDLIEQPTLRFQPHSAKKIAIQRPAIDRAHRDHFDLQVGYKGCRWNDK